MQETTIARRGFTLIELSVVLVIIGLIVGGVLVGRDLIHAAQIRSLITDEQRYITAVNTFREKYGGLPGDITNATNFWGADTHGGGCPQSGYYTPTQTTTCNGNGNGLIENDAASGDFTAPAMFENFQAWKQLANAGLIPGSFSGVPGPGSVADNEPGLNVPATKLGGGFEWTVFSSTPGHMASNLFPGAQYSTQYLLLGAAGTAGNSGFDLEGVLLSPADALSIDTKIDDGLPATGSVLGSAVSSWNQSGCLTMPASVFIYDLTFAAPGCTVLFAARSW